MIELLQGFPDDIVAIAYRGRVSGKDYETVLVPAVEAALTRHDKVRLYCEIPDGFEGFDAAAVWDDWKLGFGHLTRWGPVAAVTDVAWIRNTALARTPRPRDAGPCATRPWPSAPSSPPGSRCSTWPRRSRREPGWRLRAGCETAGPGFSPTYRSKLLESITFYDFG